MAATAAAPRRYTASFDNLLAKRLICGPLRRHTLASQLAVALRLMPSQLRMHLGSGIQDLLRPVVILRRDDHDAETVIDTLSPNPVRIIHMQIYVEQARMLGRRP